MIEKSAVREQLRELGITPGSCLLVHAAFSHVGPVEDGCLGMIAVLRDILGPNGTLMMPSMTSDDDHPFDPGSTDCRGMVGQAQARLARSRDIVRVVVKQLHANETAFLHPMGHDEQCDDAWSSLATDLPPMSAGRI